MAGKGTPELPSEWIDTPAALEGLCRHLAQQPWFALDTEFLREKTYYPRLCLVQVGTPERLACIDPLALDDLAPLRPVLEDRGIVKVVHAAHQDLEIFYHLFGRAPAPVFDTQIAAPLLGLRDQAGYGALVQHFLGIKLQKGHARTDWCRRPLSAAQVRYAADDVRYLARVYPLLRGELERRGRLDWLAPDFEALVQAARFDQDPQEAWRRIKGAGRLRGRARAALQALAAWREHQARRLDRPRRWILSDEVLLAIARLRPDSLETLASVRGLPPRTLREQGQALLDALAGADRAGPEAPPSRVPQPPLTPQQEALVDILTGVLRLLADAESVHPSVLAVRRDLEQAVRGDRSGPLFQGWRYRLAGQALEEVLAGERCLRLAGGSVQWVDC